MTSMDHWMNFQGFRRY
ncbi:hypothetical protein CcCBS67573_g05275 [Chytriomyces confervae]|uniref:Uncharacterized protein n=1 Tax=Chytriomyces confervae TaxID=246404 RepID=A0A507FAU0_9FUNG|nr:hypothetical protein CcCBS67573_g05275 [Chytriomyces confervae]